MSKKIDTNKKKRAIRLPKKAVRIILFIFSFFILLLIVFLLSLQSSRVQTYLTQKVADFMSSQIHSGITVGKVDIEFFNKIVIKDILIKDNKQDTLLFLKTLKADIIEIDNSNEQIFFDKIVIDSFVLKVYKDKNQKFNYDYVYNLLNPKKRTDILIASSGIPENKTWKFDFKKLTIINSAIAYKKYNAKKYLKKNFFNNEDFYLKNIYFSIDDFKNENDTISFHIENISFIDKSGFYLKKFTSYHKISPKTIEYKNLEIQTPYTSIKSEILKIDFDSLENLKNLDKNVKINFLLNHSAISFKDITFFLPSFLGFKNNLKLEGKIKGTLGSLHGENVNFYFGKETKLLSNFTIKNLDNPKKMYVNFNLEDLIISQLDLKTIPNLELPAQIKQLGKINLKTQFTKFKNDFIIKNKIATDLGKIDLNIYFQPTEEGKISNFKGDIYTENLNIGKLIYPKGTKEVLEIGLENQLEGVFLDDGQLQASMKGKILRMLYNEYLYKDIQIESEIDKEKIKGEIIIEENNPFLSGRLSFDFKFKDLGKLQ